MLCISLIIIINLFLLKPRCPIPYYKVPRHRLGCHVIVQDAISALYPLESVLCCLEFWILEIYLVIFIFSYIITHFGKLNHYATNKSIKFWTNWSIFVQKRYMIRLYVYFINCIFFKIILSRKINNGGFLFIKG